jgi:hypothetical protein
MTQIPSHFQLDFQPIANPEAVVVIGSARFTVFTTRLIRLEYDANGRFQDAPSQPFWYRNQPVPKFEQGVVNGRLHLTTDHLQLSYQVGRPFSAKSLQITLKASGTVWHFGDKNPTNLRGTYRTLDEVSGSTPLEQGLLSRSGWALVDDSHTLIFNQDGWLEPRPNPDALDLYFFGYGQAYNDCLRDYFALTGPVPLLPRWALGNWWSRYWAYTQAELTQLMQDFRQHDVPLSVCIVDIDWHLAGWTGYTWNRDLFPDPPQFIAWLHAQGLKTALNLHPADGVGPHEAQYPAMVQRQWACQTMANVFPSTSPARILPMPTLNFCTIRTKQMASISGGWTGSRASSKAAGAGSALVAQPPALLRPGHATASNGRSSSRAGVAWATTATPSASPATRL